MGDYTIIFLLDNFPPSKSDDGTLEWIAIENIFNKKIIPTTKKVLEEWIKKEFSSKSFTL